MKTDNEIAHELFMPLAGEENTANMTKQEAQRKNLKGENIKPCYYNEKGELIYV